MSDKSVSVNVNPGRRQFLRLLSGGSLLCFGCGALGASPLSLPAEKGPAAGGKHKFEDDSKMTMAEVFKFTYNEITKKVKLLADIMEKHIGRDKFLEYLKEAGIKSGEIDGKKYAEILGKTDLVSFASELREPTYMVNHILTYKILQDTEKVFEARITECHWAKVFREHNAADIGNAMFCNRDFTTARAFNPKIKLIRTKTLMSGCDHCNHRWILEG